MSTTASAHSRSNRDFDWDAFNPAWYQNHNYDRVRDDDRRILEIVRDHFSRAPRTAAPSNRCGLDIGAGPNLYPAFSQLPFCGSVDLVEYSDANIAWQRAQLAEPDASWEGFWRILESDENYRDTARDWRQVLRERARVSKGSIFELAAEGWDQGTMFFVAESITREETEFQQAVRCFLTALRPDSPFAAAFMENSTGYSVDRRNFPAIRIDRSHIERAFAGSAYDIRIARIDEDQPLRLGYTGMLVVTGFRGDRPTMTN